MTRVLHTAPAWDLIGFDGQWPMDYDPYADPAEPEPTGANVRLKGGRAGYEAVLIRDNGDAIRVARLDADEFGLKQINRYVSANQILEVIAV